MKEQKKNHSVNDIIIDNVYDYRAKGASWMPQIDFTRILVNLVTLDR